MENTINEKKLNITYNVVVVLYFVYLMNISPLL